MGFKQDLNSFDSRRWDHHINFLSIISWRRFEGEKLHSREKDPYLTRRNKLFLCSYVNVEVNLLQIVVPENIYFKITQFWIFKLGFETAVYMLWKYGKKINIQNRKNKRLRYQPFLLFFCINSMLYMNILVALIVWMKVAVELLCVPFNFFQEKIIVPLYLLTFVDQHGELWTTSF